MNRESLTRAKQRKIAFVNEKRERAGLSELERELLSLDPDYNKDESDRKGMELAELWLGEGSKIIEDEFEEGFDLDCAGIVKGTACGEFAAIVKRQ